MSEEAPRSPWPVIIGLGIGIFLLSAGAGLKYHIAGAIILAAGVLGWSRDDFRGRFAAPEEFRGERWPFEWVGKVKLGMWIFLASETLFFGTIIASYLYLRLKSPSWPAAGEILSISHGTLNTFVLLTSSFTLVLGLAAIRSGNQRGLRAGLILTLLLGALFLAIKASEWNELLNHGFTPGSGLPGSTYYFTTGMHGLHVLAGLAGLSYLLAKSLRGGFTMENHVTVDHFGLYWHFVDIVWVFLFPLFYLLP